MGWESSSLRFPRFRYLQAAPAHQYDPFRWPAIYHHAPRTHASSHHAAHPHAHPQSKSAAPGSLRGVHTLAINGTIKNYARSPLTGNRLEPKHNHMDWRHLSEMMTAGRQIYTQLKNLYTLVRELRPSRRTSRNSG